jgi:hypothetical protein
MNELSVVILVGSQDERLHTLVASLHAQTRRPDELVIAYTVPHPPQLRQATIPVRTVQVAGVPPPRARARNEGALLAKGPGLLFIDPACIPAPTAIAAFRAALSAADCAFVGDARELPEGVRSVANAAARRDTPASRGIVTRRCEYEDFTATTFAIRRATYGKIGGMDPRFAGFGGDAADFAASLELHGVPLFHLASACVYQRAEARGAPLQHFDDIIRNAWTYYRKWGQWPMRRWLEDLEAGGYVRLDAEGLRVLRAPTSEEVEAAVGDAQRRAPPGAPHVKG